MTQRPSFWRRLRATNQELAAEDLQKVSAQSGAMPVARCQDRDVVDCVGTLASVTINPQSERRWLEAEFDDGSGRVLLVWMGRRRIPGIEAGRRLRVQGRMSYVDGRRTVYNPRYELLP